MESCQVHDFDHVFNNYLLHLWECTYQFYIYLMPLWSRPLELVKVIIKHSWKNLTKTTLKENSHIIKYVNWSYTESITIFFSPWYE